MLSIRKHLIGALAYLFLQALSLFVSPPAYGQYDTDPIRVIYIDFSGRPTDEQDANYIRVIYQLWRGAYPYQDYLLSKDSIHARGFLKNYEPRKNNGFINVGPYISFYRNMKLEQSGQYDSLGRRYGSWDYLNTIGDTIKREIYRADSVVSSTCYDLNGSVIHHGSDCGYVDPIPLNLDELKKNVVYPKRLAKEGIAGKVVLRVLVLKNGRINLSNVKKTFVDNSILYEAIFDHLYMLRFTPAQYHGNAINCWVTIPFDFKVK